MEVEMKQLPLKYPLFFLTLSLSMIVSATDVDTKHLPVEITDNELFTINISYNENNLIDTLTIINCSSPDNCDLTENYYSYYDDGFLKEFYSTVTINDEESMDTMVYKYHETYRYEKVDSIIKRYVNRTFNMNGLSYDDKTTLCTELYLNKFLLPYKIVDNDSSNMRKTSILMEYGKNNRIKKSTTTINNEYSEMLVNTTFEVLESVEKKSVFFDVNLGNLLQTMLQNDVFMLFTGYRPMLIRTTIEIDGQESNIRTHLIYEINEEGYPASIVSLSNSENGLVEDTTLYIKYLTIKD